MEIVHVGGLSFKVKSKNCTVIFAPGELLIEDFRIAGPGEYEVKGVAVLAVIDGDKLIFRAKIDEVVFLYPASQKEEIDGVDVLFTDDSAAVAKIEPKLVVPMGEEENVKKVIRDLGKEGLVKLPKLVTSADKLSDLMEVVWL